MPDENIPLLGGSLSGCIVVRAEKQFSRKDMLADVGMLSERVSKYDYLINLCGDRYFFLLGFCSALVGRVINILPPNIQPGMLNSLLSTHPNNMVLVDSDQFSDLPNTLDIRTIDFGIHAKAIDSDFCISTHQIAAIAFTSGSTGAPTSREKTWGALAGVGKLLNQRLCASVDAVPNILATVPAQHMYGLETSIMMALQGEGSVHFGQPFYPQDIADNLRELPAPRVLVSTPVHLKALMRSGVKLPKLSFVLSATAPMPLSLAQDLELYMLAPVMEIYGCTEAGSLATRRTINGNVWDLLDGVTLSKANYGYTVCSSHLVEDVPLSDNLTMISSTSLALHGRAQDMLKVAGKRASLNDLTQKLLDIDGVHDAVVFVPENNSGGEPRPAALIVASDLSVADITTELALFVDPVFLPRPIRKVASLPRSGTGKISMGTLMSMLNE